MVIHESMFFFPGLKNKRLLGFFHEPETRSKNFAILYCHPFAEERNLSHAVAVKAARAMASSGIPVFRFDFSGSGDSEGDLEDASLYGWLEEILLATNWLQEKTGLTRICFWGLRSGATLALAASKKFQDTTVAVGAGEKAEVMAMLWHPVVDFKIMMTQFLRQEATAVIAGSVPSNGGTLPKQPASKKIETGETVEVLGYRISPLLYTSFIEMGSQIWKNNGSGNVVLFAIGTQATVPPPLKKAAVTLREAGFGVMVEAIDEPTFWDRFWCFESEKLVESSLAWLESQA